MPVKPPRGGSTRVDTDVHTRPNRNSDKDFSQARTPGRDGTAPWDRVDDPKLRNTSLGDAIRDTTLPATMVEVRPAQLPAETPQVIYKSLESYRIKSAAVLPDADSEGFRLYKNRQYVDAPDVTNMPELRVLDLSYTGIKKPPAGLGSSQLEVLKIHNSPLLVAPSLRGLTALLEVDLSRTSIRSFPEGVTSEIPKTRLDLVYTNIESIPETIELRKGFDLSSNPISDPASLRRLIAARRQTGTDIWLGRIQMDLGINHWMHAVPQAQHAEKVLLWGALSTQANVTMMRKISALARTPEFLVERALLQRRVWSFLEHFQKAGLGEQETLRDIAVTEPGPGKMLDNLEEEIKKFDPTWQHQPPHHLPKRPRLD